MSSPSPEPFTTASPSLGLHLAESTNFAFPDWLPIGLEVTRKACRPSVFSVERLAIVLRRRLLSLHGQLPWTDEGQLRAYREMVEKLVEEKLQGWLVLVEERGYEVVIATS